MWKAEIDFGTLPNGKTKFARRKLSLSLTHPHFPQTPAAQFITISQLHKVSSAAREIFGRISGENYSRIDGFGSSKKIQTSAVYC